MGKESTDGVQPSGAASKAVPLDGKDWGGVWKGVGEEKQDKGGGDTANKQAKGDGPVRVMETEDEMGRGSAGKGGAAAKNNNTTGQIKEVARQTAKIKETLGREWERRSRARVGEIQQLNSPRVRVS